MADVGRIPRRKKGARFHPKEAPFPIPIQSISGKQSSTDRWYYYTGHFRDNCVVIEDSGDLTFLYKMGFFGKGFLSRSKPEYETISNISQKAFSKSEKLRRLPPREREIRQSKFRIVRKERFKNHKQWWQQATGTTCKQGEKTCESLGDKIVNKKGIISPSPKKRKRMHVETAKLKDVTSVNQLEFCNGTIETETQSNDNDNDDDGDDDDDDDNNKEEEDDDGVDYNDDDDDDDDDRNVLSNSNGDGEASITNRDLDEVMQDVVRNKRGSSSASRLESNQKKSDRAIAKEKGTNHKACSTRQDDPYKVYEHLQLSLEEAFFLSYGLGCLSVLDKDKKPLSLGQMWCAFCEAKQEFIPNYVSYHYFRSKGWVPKMGIKYGTDLVLYKEGMPFYHSSYSVIVQMVDHQREDTEKSAKTISGRELSWRQLCGVGRVNEHAAKELMICYVIKPSDMKNEELSSPKCISRFKIQEVVLRRWIPERAREPDKEKS